MKEYIVFASAGGVFLLLLIAYLLVSIETWKRKARLRRAILKLYREGKELSKVEYDFAFYDNALHGGDSRAHHAQQVTIDDYVSGETERDDKEDELWRFRPLYDSRESTIVGHYNPEASNN